MHYDQISKQSMSTNNIISRTSAALGCGCGCAYHSTYFLTLTNREELNQINLTEYYYCSIITNSCEHSYHNVKPDITFIKIMSIYDFFLGIKFYYPFQEEKLNLEMVFMEYIQYIAQCVTKLMPYFSLQKLNRHENVIIHRYLRKICNDKQYLSHFTTYKNELDLLVYIIDTLQSYHHKELMNKIINILNVCIGNIEHDLFLVLNVMSDELPLLHYETNDKKNDTVHYY